MREGRSSCFQAVPSCSRHCCHHFRPSHMHKKEGERRKKVVEALNNVSLARYCRRRLQKPSLDLAVDSRATSLSNMQNQTHEVSVVLSDRAIFYNFQILVKLVCNFTFFFVILSHGTLSSFHVALILTFSFHIFFSSLRTTLLPKAAYSCYTKGSSSLILLFVQGCSFLMPSA